MQKNEAISYIKSHATNYLQADKSKKGYICPICGSGTGINGTGITTKDNEHFTCWAGCFKHSDIIDIIGQKHGVTEFNDKLQAAIEEFNLIIDDSYNGLKSNSNEKTKKIPFNNNIEPNDKDYSTFFLQANKGIEKTKYHRGLSLDTLNRFKIGYVEQWKNPKAPKAYATPRLIIPTSKNSYLARDTRENLSKEQKKYNKIKVGSLHFFNIESLKTAKQPVFLVEGEIDALSIIDVGGEAIALGSIANINTFLKVLKNQECTQPIVILMDNDSAGLKASEKLIKGLQTLNIQFYKLGIPNPYKDANDVLNGNRDVLKTLIEDVNNIEKQQKEIEKEQLKKEAVSYSLYNFLEEIEKSKSAPFFSTGFKKVDELLDGGLYAGLYIVGAISSLGKTTFCLQIADQIAKTGQDVIIFSLEMDKKELMAKSISRLSFMSDVKDNCSTMNAKTTRGILTGRKYINYSPKEKELIEKAFLIYAQYAKNIYINVGVGNVGVKEIRERVERHIRITGKIPIVLIDYLQIIAPTDIRATDKQNTDKAVLELKRLSRDYNIPVIGISSFNRENYNSPVNLTSFKESGAIEYSSDVLIGLQYSGMDYQERESERERVVRIREIYEKAIEDGKEGEAQKIDVKILKNRNGTKGATSLYFYPKFNCFSEGKIREDIKERW